MADEHGDLCPILAAEEDLFGHVRVGVEVELRPPEHSAEARLHIVPVDRARRREPGEKIEGLGVHLTATEAYGRTQAREVDVPHNRPGLVENPHAAVRIVHVRGDESVVHQAHALKSVGGFGNGLLPALAAGPGDVYGYDPRHRRVQIGREVEEGALVTDEAVFRIEPVEQLYESLFLRLQVSVEDAVFAVRALRDRDHQVAAVVGYAAVKSPIFVVGPMVEEIVLGLRRADAMIVELVEVVGVLVLGPLCGLVVPAVEEPQAVVGPGGSGELHPLQVVVKVIAALHFADPPLLPVRSGGGESVGQVVSVFADLVARKGDGAVVREPVRI